MFHVFALSGLLNAAVRYGGNPGADAAFEVEAVLDTIADRRCDSEHMRSADPIAAPFPRIRTARSGCPRRRSCIEAMSCAQEGVSVLWRG
jgi:hypothetical protein